MGQKVGPPTTVWTSWSRKRNEVTTPKLPPPPRSAQKRSGCSSGLAVTRRPLAVGEEAVGLVRVVARQAEPAREVAEPAAEREAADAGGGDDAARRGQAVRVGGAVDLAPRAAAADANGPGDGVDLDRLQA